MGLAKSLKRKCFYILYVTEYVALLDIEWNTTGIFINNLLVIIYQYDFFGIST